MTMFKRIVTGGCVAAAMISVAAAQITLTKADLLNRFEVGKSISVKQDTVTKMLDIGSPGASSYDFSGLLSHAATSLTSVNLATTPYVAQFPKATHAIQTTYALFGVQATVFVYFTLRDSLLNLGLKGGVPPLPNPTVQGSLINTPADVYFKVPCTFGSQWTSAYAETTSIFFFVQQPPTGVTHHATYTVEGYGPMKLPGGVVQQALRIRRIDRRSSGTTLSYLFVSKDFALVQLTAADTAQPTSGKISVASGASIEWNSAVPTGVEAVGPVWPERYVLEQNYPNPFNPTTVVSFQLPVADRVKLAVYDLLGREVAILVDGEKAAGVYRAEFDAANLPSGVYIARMQTAGFSDSRKMVLMR